MTVPLRLARSTCAETAGAKKESARTKQRIVELIEAGKSKRMLALTIVSMFAENGCKPSEINLSGAVVANRPFLRALALRFACSAPGHERGHNLQVPSHLLARGGPVLAFDRGQHAPMLRAGLVGYAFGGDGAHDPLVKQIANQMQRIHQNAVGRGAADGEVEIDIGLNKLLGVLLGFHHAIEMFS